MSLRFHVPLLKSVAFVAPPPRAACTVEGFGWDAEESGGRSLQRRTGAIPVLLGAGKHASASAQGQRFRHGQIIEEGLSGVDELVCRLLGVEGMATARDEQRHDSVARGALRAMTLPTHGRGQAAEQRFLVHRFRHILVLCRVCNQDLCAVVVASEALSQLVVGEVGRKVIVPTCVGLSVQEVGGWVQGPGSGAESLVSVRSEE